MKTKNIIAVAVLSALMVAGSAFAAPGNNGGGNGGCGVGQQTNGCGGSTAPETGSWWNNHNTSNGGQGGSATGGAGGNGTGVGVGVGQGGAGGVAHGGTGTGGSVIGGNSSGGTANTTSGSATTTGGNVTSAGNGNVDSRATTNSGNVTTGDSQSLSAATVGDTYNAVRGGTQISDASNTGGNSAVSVDSSDRSVTNYESQALFLPTIQTAAPALVANPTLVVDRGVCGPRQAKVQERVQGTYVGVVKRSSIDLGVDDELVPADEPYRYWTDPQGAVHVFGHQVVTFASVNGVAASRSVGLGGGKTGGDWGQAGASSGSSVQRTILRIQLHECEIPIAARETIREVAPKRIGQ